MLKNDKINSNRIKRKILFEYLSLLYQKRGIELRCATFSFYDIISTQAVLLYTCVPYKERVI